MKERRYRILGGEIIEGQVERANKTFRYTFGIYDFGINLWIQWSAEDAVSYRVNSIIHGYRKINKIISNVAGGVGHVQ